MKPCKPASRFPFLAGALLALLAGCSDYDDDEVYYTYGEPYYYTSDYYDMGVVYDPYYYYWKRAASAADSVPGETVLEPLAFHAECGCFVRRATFTGVAGYERERTDTVVFIDSLGDTLTGANTAAKAATVLHKRRVVDVEGGRDADILFDLTGEVVTDSVKKSIWNGTISGSFNGRAITAGSVDSVVRIVGPASLGRPVAGTLSLQSEVTDLLIEFQPDSTAKATITNKQNGQAYEVTVDTNFVESEPVVMP